MFVVLWVCFCKFGSLEVAAADRPDLITQNCNEFQNRLGGSTGIVLAVSFTEWSVSVFGTRCECKKVWRPKKHMKAPTLQERSWEKTCTVMATFTL